MSIAEHQAKIAELQKESERLGGWMAVLASEKGKHAKFLKSELHNKWSSVKDSYRRIDVRNANKDAVINELLVLQAEERFIEELLGNFQDLQIRKNVLDKNISLMIQATPSEEILDPLSRQPE